MPIRRSKKRIRDKIVELGLVDNVSELRKKRSGKKKEQEGDKSGRRKSRIKKREDDHLIERPPSRSDDSGTSSDESSGESSDSDSDGDDAPPKSRKKLYGFSNLNVESFEPEVLKTRVQQLVENGKQNSSAALRILSFFSMWLSNPFERNKFRRNFRIGTRCKSCFIYLKM